ncbi:MAG TPA: alpha/beta fold hydrolase [Vicinamibacteria bacterium]|nr:alpha/beta fold hydrolase [Vicinamibacteria bacterium]
MISPAVGAWLTAAVVGTVPSFDGVPLRYEAAGQGSPAVVFVHCWTCDRRLWDHAAARLARERRVVTLDLAGHGESGRGRRAWTIEAFGEDVKAVVEALALDRVVLVGHSMGGPVILEAARRLPGKVAGLVPVDTLQNVEDRPSPEQVAAFLAPFRADYEAAAGRFIREYLFLPGPDPALVDRIVRQAAAVPAEIAIPCLEASWGYDAARAFASVSVPIRAVNAGKYPTERQANRRHAPQFDAVVMDGVGHYPMLEDPPRFEALLARTVRDVVAESAALAVLQRQVEAWNAGDLEAFCSVYDHDATYVSPAGVFRGRSALLERYRTRYPGRAAMGTLRLELQEARALAAPGPEADGGEGRVHGVSIVARWRLAYPDKPEASGLTLIVLKPRADGWAIVQDASF